MNNLNVNSLSVQQTIGRSEYGRVKVALPRGKGFMDWVRITTGKILAKQRLASVDHVELARHDKKTDCWVHIFGQVYDVTSYLDFHPGGVDELMRAAGRAKSFSYGTPLFNQYHAWVNYESMLKACFVGRFAGDLSKLKPCGPPTTEPPTTSSLLSSSSALLPPQFGSLVVPFTKRQHFGAKIKSSGCGVTFESEEWTALSESNVVVCLGDEENAPRLRVLVHHFGKPSMEFVWKNLPSWFCDLNYRVQVTSTSVRVDFIENGEEKTSHTDEISKVLEDENWVSYHKCEIAAIRQLTHDVLLFELCHPPTTCLRIPVGHHVSVKVRKGAATLFRPYTPVMTSCSEENSKMDERIYGKGSAPGITLLMIKIYSDGICTPSLGKLAVGGHLEISDPIGDIDFVGWMDDADLVVALAGGTGITPIIDTIERRRNDNSKATFVVMFNKSDRDVLTAPSCSWTVSRWKDAGSDRFIVKDVLSNVETNDGGYEVGRVSGDVLKKVGVAAAADRCSPLRRKAFICGPDGFIIAARSALDGLGFVEDNIHVFQG